MARFTVPDGVSGISTCGQDFAVVEGVIDAGDTSSDVVSGLLSVGCVAIDETADPLQSDANVDARSEKQKIRDQLTEAGIDHDARANVATLSKLLPV